MSIYDVTIPELILPGKQGEAELVHFTVDEAASLMTSFRAVQHPDAYVPPGQYAQLRVNGTIMMSDTRMERHTNAEFTYKANGRVLVAGLGLGLILFAIADKPNVERIVVVEKSQDVIDLIGPTLRAKFDDRLEIICADIFDWKPEKGTRFDTIYFDIWPRACTDNLEEMNRLHRRFRTYLCSDGWMDSWRRKELQLRKRYAKL